MNPMFLALIGLCQAFETEPQEFRLQDEVTVMEGAAFQTGFVPTDWPVMVNFAVETNQVAQVQMDGLATLSWPEALTLSFFGVPGSGVWSTLAELAAVTSVKIDLWGYVGEWEVDRRSLQVKEEGFFDPLLLGQTTSVDNSGSELQAFEIAYEPITGISIGVSVELSAAIDTAMTGLRVEHDNGALMEADTDTAHFDVPEDGLLDITSRYVALWESSMELIVTPVASVCVDILGCYDVEIYDIPVGVSERSLEDPMNDVAFHFSLPYMDVPTPSYDFGEVEVGTLANLELPIGNHGAIPLEGLAVITGSNWFDVYPGTVMAADDTEDGLVVTFAPLDAGTVDGTLVLTTNDPLNPVYEVDLTGTGVLPPEDDVEGEDVEVISTETGCGCVSSPRRTPGVLALFLPLVVFARRRQRDTESRSRPPR